MIARLSGAPSDGQAFTDALGIGLTAAAAVALLVLLRHPAAAHAPHPDPVR